MKLPKGQPYLRVSINRSKVYLKRVHCQYTVLPDLVRATVVLPRASLSWTMLQAGSW